MLMSLIRHVAHCPMMTSNSVCSPAVLDSGSGPLNCKGHYKQRRNTICQITSEHLIHFLSHMLLYVGRKPRKMKLNERERQKLEAEGKA